MKVCSIQDKKLQHYLFGASGMIWQSEMPVLFLPLFTEKSLLGNL